MFVDEFFFKGNNHFNKICYFSSIFKRNDEKSNETSVV